MLKASTKLSVTGAATLLGVALLGGGAYAAAGSLTADDAPGQVLQVSGVGPTAGQASATALVHANAKDPLGTTPSPPKANDPSIAQTTAVATLHSAVGQVARPAPQTLPAYHAVTPQVAASPQPVAPSPMMTRGTNTSPTPMH